MGILSQTASSRKPSMIGGEKIFEILTDLVDSIS